jgi:pSer/pThr/pTyr-binding forkhead associated (FHA) protein
VGLRDLGSTNGTVVNGRRIETVLVTPHDEISFGSQVFRIELA